MFKSEDSYEMLFLYRIPTSAISSSSSSSEVTSSAIPFCKEKRVCQDYTEQVSTHWVHQKILGTNYQSSVTAVPLRAY